MVRDVWLEMIGASHQGIADPKRADSQYHQKHLPQQQYLEFSPEELRPERWTCLDDDILPHSQRIAPGESGHYTEVHRA
jgi:hypothetical protein